MIDLKDWLKVGIISLFISYTLYEKFMLPELQIPMIVSIIFVAVCYFVKLLRGKFQKFEVHEVIAYIIFAIFMIIGDSFKTYGSLHGVIGNPFAQSDLTVRLFEDFAPKFSFLNGTLGNMLMLFSSVCKGIGYYFIIGYMVKLIKKIYINLTSYKLNFKGFDNIINKIFSGNVFFNVLIILLVAWSPYFLIKFPGSVSADAMWQIEQFLGETELTTHHPIFSTFLIGSCVKFGLLAGSKSLGIFTYVFLQNVVMAAVFAYSIKLINDLKNKNLFTFLLLLLYAFSPAFPSYATSVVKDTFYCAVFVLFIVSLIKVVFSIKNDEIKTKDIILCAITSFLVMLSRNNGIYSVVPTLIVLIIVAMIKQRKNAKLISILFVPIILYAGYDFLQYDVFKVQRGSVAEMLSIPFQQTARYVKYNSGDVTTEEAEIIDRVLDYENLADLYIPTVSDPVKGTYKKDEEALKEYFKVWFEQLKKDPLIYVEATLNNVYHAFYPDAPNIRAYMVNLDLEGDSLLSKVFLCLRILLLGFTMGLSLIPIVSIFINPVYYIWCLIYLTLRSLFKKRFYDLIIFLPMLVQILVIIAGPAVFNHPRYLYPIYWSIPIVICFLGNKEKVK